MSPRTIGTKTLVAIDLEGNQGAVRHMDRERYQQIMDRWKALKSELKERGDEVRAAYKEAQPYLTSTEFGRSILDSMKRTSCKGSVCCRAHEAEWVLYSRGIMGVTKKA